MNAQDQKIWGRRRFLKLSAGGALALSLPACSTFPGLSLTDAVRRLLLLSSENAFARLTADGGYWDEQVGQLGLDQLIGVSGNSIGSFLTSNLFKSRLDDAFANVAIRGAEVAAPIVVEAVRNAGITGATAILRGGPTAARDFLQGQMGDGLVQMMVPELGQAIRIANEPLVGQLINSLTGVDAGGIASRMAGSVNDAIWREIGVEETAIRRDPQSTGDPLLIGTLAVGSAL